MNRLLSGASFPQHLDDLGVTKYFCFHQGGVTPFIPCIHIRPCLDQKLNDFGFSLFRCHYKGFPITYMSRMHVRTSVQQDPHNCPAKFGRLEAG